MVPGTEDNVRVSLRQVRVSLRLLGACFSCRFKPLVSEAVARLVCCRSFELKGL